MRPISFAQMTGELTRPPSMSDEECSPLPVHYSMYEETIISCWRPTWRERLAILFGKPVWLLVFGYSHPPVDIQVQSPFAP
jgi:hypothetical protein